jgi:hypothetical protein
MDEKNKKRKMDQKPSGDFKYITASGKMPKTFKDWLLVHGTSINSPKKTNKK